MITNMFVQNEPVHACCGRVHEACNCKLKKGFTTDTGHEKDEDRLMNVTTSTGMVRKMANNTWKPEPMPVYNWDAFYDAQAGKAPATTKATYKSAKPSRSSAKWKPEPMPVFNWDEFYSRR